jgi:hypothetical protein
MQAVLWILRRYHLAHLQIHFLQTEEGCTFLQHPAKGIQSSRPGTRGAHLVGEVPPDGVRTGVTSITFHACFLKRTSKGRQSFLPRDDGTFSAIKLPLPSKELLLQLDVHYR